MRSTIFVTADVLIVCCLSVLPLAVFLVARLRQSHGRWHAFVVAVLLMAACLALVPSAGDNGALLANLAHASLKRSCAAVGLATSMLLLITAMSARSQRRPPSAGSDNIVNFGAAILMAVTLPWVYVQARVRHDQALLSEHLEQSRFGDARELVQELIQLSPRTELRGQPLRTLLQNMDRQVRDLETDVAKPSDKSQAPEHQLERCRRLAMLGRTAEALDRLIPLMASPVVPQACDLSGTIHETLRHWETARGFHQRAKTEWLGRPPTADNRAGLLRSVTRLGYCERKLGHYPAAEAEYRQALAYAPTAQTHFLLAQFYEDMQHSAKARIHARRAMELDPRRYQRAGTELIDKLMVHQFGCLGVFDAEKSAR